MKRLSIITIAILLAAFAAVAQDQPTTQPAAQSGAMKATVVSVSGMAEKLVAADGADKWTPLTAGEELDEQTIIRTGLRTRVVLKMDDRGEIVIDRATKVGIGEFRKQDGGLVRTRLGLKYGAMRATVDSSRGPNDMSVATPVATLSVRGTQGDIGYTSDRGLGLKGREGTWRLAVGNRTRDVKAGEEGNNQLTPSIELLKTNREIILGDVTGGLTNSEIESIVNNPSPANPTEPNNSGQPAPNLPPPSESPLPDNHISPGI